MSDYEAMDRWLRDAMATAPPQLSSSFDAQVMARVRPRRLTSGKRAVLVAYAIGSVLLSAWMMRDVGPALAAVSTLAFAVVATGLGGYVRTITVNRSST